MASVLNLQGKTAIVTGGSQGIGREISITLARQGASVVVNYASNVDKANETVSQIEKASGKVIAVQGDVSSESAVKGLFDKAEEAFGPVHIVINCGGMLLPHVPSVEKTTEEEWDRIYSVNTKGAFLVSREAAIRIPPGGGGRIVNISTILVSTLLPNMAAYTSSKAAVETFTKILAKELKGSRITANSVAPGPVATELFYSSVTDTMVESVIESTPLQRLGQPRDIANVVLFLVSDEGEWVNGQVIRAGGGLAS